MKVKTRNITVEELSKLKKFKYKKPCKPSLLFKYLIRFLSTGELKTTNFKYELVNIDKIPNTPCLVLMNHSSFIDPKIASKILKNKRYNIVSAKDSFINKNLLMRVIGCIPTHKFINDVQVVKDIQYCLTKLKTDVLLYPEAGYTFDGTSTVLPKSLGKLCKLLKVPVISIITNGAFLRGPLYNNLQYRKVDVSAKVKLLFSVDDLKNLSTDEINQKIKEEFSFDDLKYQLENKVQIKDSTRADSLNRILYKCPYCLTEGEMVGKGTELYCEHCKKTHILNEYGQLEGVGFEAKFSHIPDWYKWERDEVRKELLNNEYNLECEVDVYTIVDTKAFYKLGTGTLKHNNEGVFLNACDNKINYHLPPQLSYTLNCDFFFYEIADTISFGDMKTLYYCFPKNKKDIVTKARLASEELFKIKTNK